MPATVAMLTSSAAVCTRYCSTMRTRMVASASSPKTQKMARPRWMERNSGEPPAGDPASQRCGPFLGLDRPGGVEGYGPRGPWREA
jgi:hypothetical protein